MTTDNNENDLKERKSDYSIENYIKGRLEDKYQNKPVKMVRQELNDGTLIVGKRVYDNFKNIPKDLRTESQQEKIDDFEEFHKITEQIKKSEETKKESNARLQKQEQKKQNAIKNINKASTYKVFKKYYKEINGVDFIETKETLENLKPLILYFSKDEEFLKYGAKNDKGNYFSQPSLDKGLCIIGGFGNGKTSIMNTFQKMFIGLDDYSFGRFSSHELVIRYEEVSKSNISELIENFWKLLTRSTLYIDDVKAEPLAFAYGKKNMINTMFLERYNKNLKTHISMNFASGHNHDIKEALIELKSKYSNQFYDRVFEMCNIIEFKGKTFRR